MGFKDIDHEMTEENQAAFNSVQNALTWSEEHGMEVQVIYYVRVYTSGSGRYFERDIQLRNKSRFCELRGKY